MTSTETFETFLVGGAVRDELLGVRSHDLDFTVVGPTSFEAMLAELETRGFKVFLATPETVTARCKVPTSMPDLATLTNVADFVLARKESSASTGRRPDLIEVGTLADDLGRRDFTINALARSLDGTLIDLFGGVADLETRTLRFVGDPMLRIREDALRILRAFRFAITKGFTFAPETAEAVGSPEATALLSATVEGKRVISLERMREETEKMFACDTLATLALLRSLPTETVEAMFPEGLRLSATMKA